MSDGERVTLSLEQLRGELAPLIRGELAQLELRLVDRINEAGRGKADATHVNAIEGRLISLERSVLVKGGPIDQRVRELPDENDVRAIARAEITGADKAGWSIRERFMAGAVALVIVLGFVLQLVLSSGKL